MCLTKNGKVIPTTVSDKAINALVQCTEAITLPPFTNALIKYKVPKVLKSKSYENICLFEPSYRHKSDYAECHTYEGIVVMDNEVVNSGIFHVAMTNDSSRHIKINYGQIMEMLKSCNEYNICTIHKIATFQQTSEDTKPQFVEKEMYCIPIRNLKTGKIEINTLLKKNAFLHSTETKGKDVPEDFVTYRKTQIKGCTCKL